MVLSGRLQLALDWFEAPMRGKKLTKPVVFWHFWFAMVLSARGVQTVSSVTGVRGFLGVGVTFAGLAWFYGDFCKSAYKTKLIQRVLKRCAKNVTKPVVFSVF